MLPLEPPRDSKDSLGLLNPRPVTGVQGSMADLQVLK
jgi:hypothetical protein